MEKLKGFEGKGFVFKKCKNEHCIVILKKPNENFKCNENRKNIGNKNIAKFRCNGLITVAIFNLKTEEFIDYVNHLTYFYGTRITTYKVNKLTLPDLYDERESEICSHSIHYFLSLETAWTYDGYNYDYQPVVLPEGLTTLIMGDKFNRPIFIPSTVTTLTMGAKFNQPVVLPEGFDNFNNGNTI